MRLILHLSMHFMTMLLIGIIAITNSNGDRVFPRNILLRIFTPANLFPIAVKSPLHVSMVFSINYMTSSDIFVNSETVYYPGLKDHVVSHFAVNPHHT